MKSSLSIAAGVLGAQREHTCQIASKSGLCFHWAQAPSSFCLLANVALPPFPKLCTYQATLAAFISLPGRTGLPHAPRMAVKLGLGGGQVQLAVALLQAQSLRLGRESGVGRQEEDQSMEGKVAAT